MRQRLVILFAVFASISLWPRVGAAEFPEEDHALVFEAGLAGERSIPEGVSNFGTTLAVEVTPIEEWLELEFGVTALVTSGHPELSSDLVFKKPFPLSPTSEFMIGLGPFVARTVSGPGTGTAHGVEVVLDLMFWRNRNTGWYLEPAGAETPAAGSGPPV
jgi:hypothetical protein